MWGRAKEENTRPSVRKMEEGRAREVECVQEEKL
jgi:hypothetical protein